jgi:hypothetical protein
MQLVPDCSLEEADKGAFHKALQGLCVIVNQQLPSLCDLFTSEHSQRNKQGRGLHCHVLMHKRMPRRHPIWV